MKTKIYKTKIDFLKRKNKDENGVSEEFAKLHLDFEKENITNTGCWNCSRCSRCSGCSRCSRCFDCSRCYDCSDCFGCSRCFDKNSEITIPTINNIHQKVLKAVESSPSALKMDTWHTCDTEHCRAGWVVTLAGEEGKKLEDETDTAFAAYQIYKASSPIKVAFPRFYEDNETAMADIIRCAKEEKEL